MINSYQIIMKGQAMEILLARIQYISFLLIALMIYIGVFVLINCIESKKYPTFCLRRGNIYEVHMYVQFRTYGDYEVYHFSRQGNRWHYVKKKEKTEKIYYIVISVAAIVFLIYLAIHIGLVSGLGILFLVIISFLGLRAISRMVIIRKCKRYLRKKFE